MSDKRQEFTDLGLLPEPNCRIQPVLDPAILENLYNQFNTHATRLTIEHLKNRIYGLDALHYLELFPSESVDMIFTDEPYGQPGHTFYYNNQSGRQAKNPIVRNFDWDNNLPAHLATPWVYEAARVLKDGGVLINCGLPTWASTYQQIIEDSGLTWRAHIAWIKSNPMRQIHPGSWRSGLEMMWIASKGTLKDRMKGKIPQELRVNWHIETICPNCGENHNVIDLSNYKLIYQGYSELGGLEPGRMPVHLEPFRPGSVRCHDTHKPEWIANYYTYLLTSPGDIVVDPFAGSGELILAAAKTDRFWGANDRQVVNQDNIKLRINSIQKGISL